MNDSDNSDDFKLRDKFAIEIMNAYMIAKGKDTAIVKFISNFDSLGDDSTTIDSIKDRIRAFYKLADIMRKARLASFD